MAGGSGRLAHFLTGRWNNGCDYTMASRLIAYPLILAGVLMGLSAILIHDINLYAQHEVRPPDPVKVCFKTDWHEYCWYEIPSWGKTHTKN